MTSLITNGNFDSDITGWTPQFVAPQWDQLNGCPHPGSMLLDTTEQISGASQVVPLPAIGTYRLTLWGKTDSLSVSYPILIVVLMDDEDHILLSTTIFATIPNSWEIHHLDAAIAADPVQLQFISGDHRHIWIDTVSLRLINTYALGSCADIVSELRKRRRDWSAVKHTPARYREIVAQAIAEAPVALWRTAVDSSLITLADTRRYPLDAIADLALPGQVRTVEIETGQEHRTGVAAWHVEDNDGTLTLVLHRTPAEGRAIHVEYRCPHAPLDCDDHTDVTTLDRQWLIAKALTLLLLEADPELEGIPNAIAALSAEIQRADALRQAREAELSNQLRPRPTTAHVRKRYR